MKIPAIRAHILLDKTLKAKLQKTRKELMDSVSGQLSKLLYENIAMKKFIETLPKKFKPKRRNILTNSEMSCKIKK